MSYSALIGVAIVAGVVAILIVAFGMPNKAVFTRSAPTETNALYDEGHSDGYTDGHFQGYAKGHALGLAAGRAEAKAVRSAAGVRGGITRKAKQSSAT